MEDKNLLMPADILLPKGDFSKWAVVACDQFTSEPQYWEKARELVGGTPSALNIVLPEAYLGEDDDLRIRDINRTMSDYIENDVFEEVDNALIYVEREITGGKIRPGIVGLIDLESYDYRKGSRALIRATEETVVSRIPPRIKIRRDAPLELPHIMLLIDDPEATVIEPLAEQADEFRKLYDFDLMFRSGHINGYRISENAQGEIEKALYALIENSEDKLLFAVGDGNHSLATAKECYNESGNPLARYALVEVVNIHDKSLEFEPIYRVVFDVCPKDLIEGFISTSGGEYFGEDAQKFLCLFGGEQREISVRPSAKLCVGTLQAYLDSYQAENKSAEIDYIHGQDVVRSLSEKENTVGFIFEGMQKDELFEAIRSDGSLPRKTFSMGHAADKRFYIEARKIK